MVGQANAQSATASAPVIEITGTINPVKVRYLERALEQARFVRGPSSWSSGWIRPAACCNPPGKWLSCSLNPKFPPSCTSLLAAAQAGSAGTFLTAAANFAVMAPGTNIGAATPVSASGQEMEETLSNKITNDTAAFIRSIAEERGRNGDKLEETVTKGASFTASEAAALGMVDFVASDEQDLLRQLDGREVNTRSASWALETGSLSWRS